MKLDFHHINFVSGDVDRMHDFYTKVLGLDDMPVAQFPRTEAADGEGFLTARSVLPPMAGCRCIWPRTGIGYRLPQRAGDQPP